MGAQQRLVSLSLALRAAQTVVPRQRGELEGELAYVAKGLASVLEDLEALGGTISVHSPAGAGTSLRAEFPLAD
jgi:hypothetical protein